MLPVLILLLLGMIECALLFQAQLCITHAAREGARLASVDKWDAAAVVDRAFPLKTSDELAVSLTDLGEAVRVRVTYPYRPRLLPVIGVVPLHSEATMRKEY